MSGTAATPVDSAVWARVARLDLSSVGESVRQENGWTEERVLEAEREYRRFLYMVASEPGRPVVPSAFVDAFWHSHVLDTRRYAEDCQALLGRFLHHQPGRGDQSLSDETLSRYAQAFGNGAVAGWFGAEPDQAGERGDIKCSSSCTSP